MKTSMDGTRGSRMAWTAGVLIVLLGLLLIGPLRIARSASLNETATPGSLLADQLVRLARLTLQGSAQPTVGQIQRCGTLLDLALQQNPQDADAWLLRRELARLAEDLRGEVTALARYCQLRPTDDAAQLDLILLSASSHQTVEQRASAVEKVLETPGAKQLSPALRSRLASYIAEAAREMGQEDRFGSWLRTAAELDPTNKHAARLTFELATDRARQPAAIGLALLQYITADPADARARRQLGDLLVDHVGYDAAIEQYQIASALGVADAPDQFLYRWFLALAATGRQDQMLAMMASLRTRADGEDPAPLPLDLDVIRLAVLHHAGQTAMAEESFRRIRNMYQQRVDKGDVGAAMILAWLTAYYSPTVSPEFAQAVTALAQREPGNTVMQRVLGWLMLRKGQIQEAASVFQELAENDPLALVGLARCTTSDQADLRAGYLQRAVRMAPGNLAGLIAALDLRSMGQAPGMQPVAAALAERMKQMPAVVQNPLAQQRSPVQIQVRMDPTEYEYLQSIAATISLKNTSDVPLALGVDGAIPTRMMLFLTPWQGAVSDQRDLPPVVVDARRTIRLDPQQTLSFPARVDLGELGNMLTAYPALNLTFSVTAVLNPVPAPTGGMTAGPLGGFDMIRFVDRKAMRATQGNIDAWIAYAQTPGDAIEHMRVLAVLARLVGDLQGAESADTVRRIATVINSQFPQLNVLGQAWVVASVPSTDAARQQLPAVYDLAQRSDDPLVRITYLATQVSDVNSPDIAAALRHDDPLIAGFARAMQGTAAPAAGPTGMPAINP